MPLAASASRNSSDWLGGTILSSSPWSSSTGTSSPSKVDWGPTPAPAREALRAGYEAALASDGAAPLSEAESAWAEILTLWYGLAAVRSGPRREEWAATL